MSTPKVSVLIPTFNRADLLPAALDSVFRQTYGDYEVVVVDDGSTDNTSTVLDQYKGRIRRIEGEHGGPARARNLAFANATGEYLCLLDSDDLYYEHKLELQVEHLDRYPDTVMVYTNFSAFDDKGFRNEFHLRDYHRSAYRNHRCDYEEIFSSKSPLHTSSVLQRAAAGQGKPHWLSHSEYRGDIFEAYLFDTIVFTNSMMLRRSALEVVGGQNPYFGHFHDLEFALRLCRLGAVGFIDNPTYHLRLHPGQVSAISRSDGRLNAIKLQRDLLRVARRHALERATRARSARKISAHVGRLCRAAAQPLLAYDGADERRRRSYPRKARKYLAYARQHGCLLRVLYVVSLWPAPARRLYFALERRLQRLLAALSGRR